tara:strand:+ start:393 stop:629 length:237 start_codon:yes stop_codon:yes gene_type:complete
MSTIKSNILVEIAKTFQTIGWDTTEAKNQLTNNTGMVQEVFEKEMTIEYIEANDVVRTLDTIEDGVKKIKMLIGLLKE